MRIENWYLNFIELRISMVEVYLLGAYVVESFAELSKRMAIFFAAFKRLTTSLVSYS